MSKITQGISTAITLTILGLAAYIAGSTVDLRAEKRGYEKRDLIAVEQIKAAYQAGMNTGLSQCPQSRPNRAQIEDVDWLTNEYSSLATPTPPSNIQMQ